MSIQTTSNIVRGKFETALETAYGAITSSFTIIGAPFTAPFNILYVQNFTDVIIDFSISYDGLTTTFSLAPNGIIATDMVTNSVQISTGESAWCKYRTGAPTKGFVQVSSVTPV
jgi:hypothetical protein